MQVDELNTTKYLEGPITDLRIIYTNETLVRCVCCFIYGEQM